MVTFSRSRKSVLVILLIVSVVMVCAFLYLSISRVPFFDDVVKVGLSASYNRMDSSVFVNVTSYFNQPDVFERAVVKNSAGQVLASDSFVPTVLPAYGAINLTVSLGDVVLASGTHYDLEFYTSDGKCYGSVLTIYENVRTRVSLVNADTLLVDVQSFANQTIIFERATVNEFFSRHFNGGYGALNQEDVALSQPKLLPNENLSLTISYEQRFSPGNYTFFLYSSSPDSEYVNGAYAFFTVTGNENYFNKVATIEKIALAESDNNTLLVDVKSLSAEPITFADATIKEQTGSYYAVTANYNLSPVELPPFGNATIAIKLNVHLGSFATSPSDSENYTVTLYSGPNAVWAPLTIPIT